MGKLRGLALVAAGVLAGGIAVSVSGVGAQPAPGGMPFPPGGPRPGAMGGMPGPMGRPMMEGMRGRGGPMQRIREFSLVYPAPDRALSGADVQRIAEGYLLFNGNHAWKVTEVTEEPDRVLFAFATPDGTAIAHFAMDRHTGRPERLS